MFLLLLHPLDSWKVAMIFVGNIINRVTFLFSLLFSFYWSCQKFSSSCCWRIIALSWCQIKLAKCLNLSISADLISLSRAGQLTAAVHWGLGQGTSQPIDISGRWPLSTPSLSPGTHSTHGEKWSEGLTLTASSGDSCRTKRTSAKSKWSCHWWYFECPVYILYFPQIRESRVISFTHPGPDDRMDLFY